MGLASFSAVSVLSVGKGGLDDVCPAAFAVIVSSGDTPPLIQYRVLHAYLPESLAGSLVVSSIELDNLKVTFTAIAS